MKVKLLTKRDFRELLNRAKKEELVFELGSIPTAQGEYLPYKEVTKDIFNMIKNTLVIDDFKLVKISDSQVYVKDNIRCHCVKNKIFIHKY